MTLCTAELWEGPCHSCSLSCISERSRRTAQHVYVVPSRRSTHFSMHKAVLAIPDLSIYPFIFSLQGNMKVLWTSLGAPIPLSGLYGGAKKGSL